MTRAYVPALFVLMIVLAACSQPTTTPDPVVPTVTNFTAEKSTLTAGESTTLSWTDATPGATLTLTPDIGNVTGQTSATVSPTTTTEYTLTISNDAGSNQYKQTVTVQPKDTPAPTNRTPVSESVTKSTREGKAVTVQLSGSDPDGDRLRYSIVTEPQNGSLSGLNPDTGEVSYTPNPNFNGVDTFTFSVSDGKLSSAVATVTVNVTAVNDAPTANAQTRSTPEETPVVVTLSGSDPEGADLEYVVTREPTHGTLGALEPTTHKVTYTPSQDYNGTDSFTFVVSDGELTSAEATVIIKVGVVNDQPVAKAQSVSLNEDNAKIITLTAQDADNDALTYAVVKQPEHGKLSGLNAGTGKLTYTPNKDYSGADSFTFKANDGTEDSEVQTVSLTINPVNDAPVIAGGDSVSVTMSEDGAPTAFALTLNASDVDSSTLTWSVSSGAAYGTASVSGTGASKDVTYSPNANYNGSDKFVVKVVDGEGGEDTITVNVTVTPVDDAPSALTLSNSSVDENKPVGTVVGTFSTADIDSSTFTYSFVDGSNDNAKFTIDGNALKTAESFDFETKKSYSVEVESEDGSGNTITQGFTIQVKQVSSKPANITLLIAGQSNASSRGELSNVEPGIPEVRMLGNDYVWKQASEPTDSNLNQIDQVSEDTDPQFAFGAGHSFGVRLGKNLFNATGKKVFLIQSAKGGSCLTTCEDGSWNVPSDRLNRNTLFGSANYRAQVSAGTAPNAPAPAEGGPVTGIIWYQGESEQGNSNFIPDTNLVMNAFENELNDPPIIYAQIARRLIAPNESDSFKNVNYQNIREKQRLMETQYGNPGDRRNTFYMVVTHDLPLVENNHLSAEGQKILGDRIALAYQEHVLGQGVDGTGPRLESNGVTLNGNVIRVNTTQSINSSSDYEGYFNVSAGGSSYSGLGGNISSISRDPNDPSTILITVSSTSSPLYLRYMPPSFKPSSYPTPQLQNVVKSAGTGLPLPAFGPLQLK